VVSNLITVPVGPDGEIDLYSQVGSTQLIADFEGYYLDAPSPSYTEGAYANVVAPSRMLDTRTGLGTTAGKVQAGHSVRLKAAGVGQVPADATAVILNVTETQPNSAGFVAAVPPSSSNLNFAAGQTTDNLVIAPVAPDGTVTLYTSATAHLIADVQGYYADEPTGSDSLSTVLPTRVLSTVDGTGAPKGALGPGRSVRVRVVGQAGIPSGVKAVWLNLTVTGGSSAGYLTAYADGSSVPGVSDLDFAAGETISTEVLVPVGQDGCIDVRNQAGPVNVIADLQGYFTG
jgi:hypothetical protein